jgi:hypothetical protein
LARAKTHRGRQDGGDREATSPAFVVGLLLALTFPLLIGLSRLGGFRVTTRLIDDAADALRCG